MRSALWAAVNPSGRTVMVGGGRVAKGTCPSALAALRGLAIPRPIHHPSQYSRFGGPVGSEPQRTEKDPNLATAAVELKRVIAKLPRIGKDACASKRIQARGRLVDRSPYGSSRLSRKISMCSSANPLRTATPAMDLCIELDRGVSWTQRRVGSGLNVRCLQE